MIDIPIASSTFVLVFLAEMGDKTQLIAMTLAHRYRATPVVLGVLSAFALLNLLAVVAGAVAFRVIPQTIILLGAGALFLLFAWRSWASAGEDETPGEIAEAAKVFAASFTLIFLAEFGDKTQLAVVALAASHGEPVPVFVGGTLALWAVSLIGIAVGGAVLTRFPARLVHRAAAVLFAVFGVIAIGQALFDIARS